MEDYFWETDYAHSNNTETMSEFLNDHIEPDWNVDKIDGSYAEITNSGGSRYEVHASGNGDFNHHKVEFIPIIEPQ